METKKLINYLLETFEMNAKGLIEPIDYNKFETTSFLDIKNLDGKIIANIRQSDTVTIQIYEHNELTKLLPRIALGIEMSTGKKIFNFQ